MTTPPPIIPGAGDQPPTLATASDAALTPAPKPSRLGWVVPVTAALAVLLLAAAGVAAWALMRPAGPAASDPPSPAAPTPFTIFGAFTLTDGVMNIDGSICTSMSGYDDIASGAQVTVTDAAGAVVGVGQLDFGRLEGSGIGRTCRFGFQVQGVPAGKGFYGVEVSHRGKVQFAEADFFQAVELSLG